jgi:hypothetical protein
VLVKSVRLYILTHFVAVLVMMEVEHLVVVANLVTIAELVLVAITETVEVLGDPVSRFGM